MAIIQRQSSNFTSANNYHTEAIQLLENIGAKCDLAEAYYQYALTLQQQNNRDNRVQSNIYKNNALNLFQQIEAPLQIAKVNQQLIN